MQQANSLSTFCCYNYGIMSRERPKLGITKGNMNITEQEPRNYEEIYDEALSQLTQDGWDEEKAKKHALDFTARLKAGDIISADLDRVLAERASQRVAALEQ